MNRLIIFLFAVLLSGSTLFAEEDKPKQMACLSGEITSAVTWQLEASYHYMLCPYVGVGASLGLWEEMFASHYPSGHGWAIDSDSEKMDNMYLRPSIYLVTPSLFKVGRGSLRLSVEPGFMMNIFPESVCFETIDERGFRSGHHSCTGYKGRWYAFDCKAGIVYRVANAAVSAGYMFSDLDIYAMRRDMTFQGTRLGDCYPAPERIGGAYLSLQFMF